LFDVDQLHSPKLRASDGETRFEVGPTLAHDRGLATSQRKEETMRSRFSFLVLAAAVVAAPAFAQDNQPAGRWDGVLVRDGAQAPISVDLREDDGIWRGRLELDGASSPLDGLRVAGNSVHFEQPRQGVFDGTVSGDSITGSISASDSKGADSKGSFTLSREEPPESFGDAITSSGP